MIKINKSSVMLYINRKAIDEVMESDTKVRISFRSGMTTTLEVPEQREEFMAQYLGRDVKPISESDELIDTADTDADRETVNSLLDLEDSKDE